MWSTMKQTPSKQIMQKTFKHKNSNTEEDRVS